MLSESTPAPTQKVQAVEIKEVHCLAVEPAEGHYKRP